MNAFGGFDENSFPNNAVIVMSFINVKIRCLYIQASPRLSNKI